MGLGVQREIGSGFRVRHEQRVGDPCGIEAFPRQIALLLLERFGRVELARDTDEDGPCIGRQTLGEMRRHYRPSLVAKLAGEIGKDLVKHPVKAIKDAVAAA